MDAGQGLPTPSEVPPPWYPSTLTDRTFTMHALEGGVPSPWGRFYGWDPTDVLSPSWWASQVKATWGKWPSNVEHVTLIADHRWGMEVRLDDRWTAHIYPLYTGHDVSTLAVHEPWRTSLEGSELVMPVAGLKHELGDAVNVFPLHTVQSSWTDGPSPQTLAAMCGRIQSCLANHATPNAERRWNDRLKAIEDRLKTSTLWRAPHTKAVVGLPPLHLGGADVNGSARLIPFPRPLVDRLLCANERRPGVAEAAALEQRLAINDAFVEGSGRQAFYEAWASEVPSPWSTSSAFSSANGGVWIWRYEAMLLLLAEGRAYGLTNQVKRCETWLRDVSRIQARLGELRTVLAVRKAAMYSSLATLALAVNGAGAWPLAVGAAAVSLLAHLTYRRRLPDPI